MQDDAASTRTPARQAGERLRVTTLRSWLASRTHTLVPSEATAVMLLNQASVAVPSVLADPPELATLSAAPVAFDQRRKMVPLLESYR